MSTGVKPRLGCCYYPEQWDVDLWQRDAEQMVDLGLSIVRIGEFSWSRLEPAKGHFQWQWLDDAIETLGNAGLQVVLGTPSATPPRWMLECFPDMLALDKQGRVRKFGSRRHYCFSHSGYRQAAADMAELMAQRYAGSDYVTHWQIDNEYGCHDTTVSYSDNALQQFRIWLGNKYQSIERLNECWGNVFWSMEYNDFQQIELPNSTVTEPNPIHVLDFKAFSSDQVIVFNQSQVSAIKRHSDKPLIHNYMGKVFDFDHFKLGKDLDIASWDAYPLGFLEDRSTLCEHEKNGFYRQGDPDFQAFHHDLYRAVGNGKWWVMEQQPGPVNWAPWNPAPLTNMVRLWTWEAIVHGAEVVNYFRWRQVPFAQEQMHSGLLHPDSTKALACREIQQTVNEINIHKTITQLPAKVAMVFDYQSAWAWQVQPQGEGFDYFKLQYDFYKGLRQLGLSVDFISAETDDFADYSLVLINGLMYWNTALKQAISNTKATLLVGPRTGSKTECFIIPDALPPDIEHFGCKVNYVESLRPDTTRSVTGDGVAQSGKVQHWIEYLEIMDSSIKVCASVEDTNQPIWVSQTLNCASIHYLAGWPDEILLRRILQSLCSDLDIVTQNMPKGVRRRDVVNQQFVFNYNAHAVNFHNHNIEAGGVLWN